MTESLAKDAASGQSAQQRFGHRLGERVDHLMDTTPALDGVAAGLRAVVAPIAGHRAPRGWRDALLGSWLGHPLHPTIVALPIGAWSLTSAFDLLGQEQSADLCLKAGVAAAGSAALSGFAQWDEVADRERPRRIGVVHSSLNTVATGLYIGSWVLRSRRQRGAGVAMAAAGLTVMSLSGWLGGHLAYTLGVGVEDDASARQASGGGQMADEDAGEATPDQSLDPLVG